MLCCGVDPGLSGAVAMLDHAGALVALHDTPTLTLRVARGMRQEYDLPGLVALFAALCWERRPCGSGRVPGHAGTRRAQYVRHWR